jgi:peptidoglycan/LPS O-acetylase OafA/YrhL
MRLDSFAQTGRATNNFDLLRLSAAILVVFAHSFNLLKLPEPFLSIAPMGWGFIGVLIFFSISGFLVSGSWASNPRLMPFAAKRALRILPALIVVLVLSSLVLGPLVTSDSTRAYFENPETKGYIINNTMMQSDFELPGVFTHNTYPAAVNGSLWTLPLEVKTYVFVALLGIAGLLSRRRLLMLGVAILAILACITALRPTLPGAPRYVASLVNIQANPGLVSDAKLGAYAVYAQMFAAFVVGATFYALRRWIVLRWETGLCAVAAWIITTAFFDESVSEISTVILGPYIVLCFAYCTIKWIKLHRLFGDYSYGIYIYAFPIQQTVSHALSPSSGWVLFCISMPITLALAAASWHLIERPALEVKRRLLRAEPAGVPIGLGSAITTAPVE